MYYPNNVTVSRIKLYTHYTHSTACFGECMWPPSGSLTNRTRGFLFYEEASSVQTAIILFCLSVIIPNSGIINVRILNIEILLKCSCFACSR